MTNDLRQPSPNNLWNDMHTEPASRHHTSVTSPGPTVVAVDGSPESRAALRWAADHARASGTTLKVVTAYPQPMTEVEFPPVYVDLYGLAARERALEVIESVLGHRVVDHVVVEGTIETVLVEHGEGASTIVIGTRARRRLWHRFRRSLTDRITGRVDSTVISVPYDDTISVS